MDYCRTKENVVNEDKTKEKHKNNRKFVVFLFKFNERGQADKQTKSSRNALAFSPGGTLSA